MAGDDAGLAGRSILVVEDEMLIALMIEDVLTGLGCAVLGPVGRLDAALRLASDAPIDAALLDVTVRGGTTYAVADRLAARGIPFAFASGYGGWAVQDRFRDQPRLQKPFRDREIEDTLRLLLPDAAG